MGLESVELGLVWVKFARSLSDKLLAVAEWGLLKICWVFVVAHHSPCQACLPKYYLQRRAPQRIPPAGERVKQSACVNLPGAGRLAAGLRLRTVGLPVEKQRHYRFRHKDPSKLSALKDLMDIYLSRYLSKIQVNFNIWISIKLFPS